MLEGLDQVDWQNIRHCYGPASDLPRTLRALASEDVSQVDRAIHDLFGTIWHQNTVYEASACATPYLIEVVQNRSVLKRKMILVLLASLATPNSYVGKDGIMRSVKGHPLNPRDWLHDKTPAQAAHKAVAQGIPVFLVLLSRSM